MKKLFSLCIGLFFCTWLFAQQATTIKPIEGFWNLKFGMTKEEVIKKTGYKDMLGGTMKDILLYNVVYEELTFDECLLFFRNGKLIGGSFNKYKADRTDSVTKFFAAIEKTGAEYGEVFKQGKNDNTIAIQWEDGEKFIRYTLENHASEGLELSIIFANTKDFQE